MADITLAEYNGRVWLVGGESYLSDLLANTLARDVTIEILPCERQTDVHDLWVQHCGEPETEGLPWQIHPNIVTRIRRRAPDYPVFFTQWSAHLDQDALTVIASAAAWAVENPDAPVLVAEYVDADATAAAAALSGVRAQLIADRLVAGGVDRGRIERVTRGARDVAGHESPDVGQESQRVDIIVRAS